MKINKIVFTSTGKTCSSAAPLHQLVSSFNISSYVTSKLIYFEYYYLVVADSITTWCSKSAFDHNCLELEQPDHW